MLIEQGNRSGKYCLRLSKTAVLNTTTTEGTKGGA
jgi:hypothetical protein